MLRPTGSLFPLPLGCFLNWCQLCRLCEDRNERRPHCLFPPLCLGMHECHQLPRLPLFGKCPKTLIIMVNHPWDWSRGDPTVTDWWCKTRSLHQAVRGIPRGPSPTLFQLRLIFTVFPVKLPVQPFFFWISPILIYVYYCPMPCMKQERPWVIPLEHIWSRPQQGLECLWWPPSATWWQSTSICPPIQLLTGGFSVFVTFLIPICLHYSQMSARSRRWDPTPHPPTPADMYNKCNRCPSSRCPAGPLC